MRTLFVSLSTLFLAACVSGPQPETNLTADNSTTAPFDESAHLWLEEVEGEAALA